MAWSSDPAATSSIPGSTTAACIAFSTSSATCRRRPSAQAEPDRRHDAARRCTFNGTSSSDPEGETLTYAWDLDADGSFDDSASPTPQWTYSGAGTVIARLRVTDPAGLFDVAAVAISVNNSAPVAIIDTPTGAFTWKVGDPITFIGRGTDVDQPSGLLPPSALPGN